MKYRKAIGKLNKIGQWEERKKEEKLNIKLEHLRKKHKLAKEGRRVGEEYKVKWKERFPGATIYLEEEEMRELIREVDRELDELEPLVIGAVELNTDEGNVLKYPPGTAVTKELDDFDFRSSQEEMNTKLRYELRSWNEHNENAREGLEEQEYEEMEEAEKVKRVMDEASLRQIYDPLDGILDFGKKKSTDSKFNSKSGLAKEVSKEQEMYIDVRRSRFIKIHTKFRHKGDKGRSNITEGMRKDLSLWKKELVMETLLKWRLTSQGSWPLVNRMPT